MAGVEAKHEATGQRIEPWGSLQKKIIFILREMRSHWRVLSRIMWSKTSSMYCPFQDYKIVEVK